MAERETIETLLRHWRWYSEEGRGGADLYIRVRDAAQKDGFGRAAAELERAAREGGDDALLQLAATFRRRVLTGETPANLQMPRWRADRPAPNLDQQKVQREQQIGYSLAMAACGSHLQEAAGGEM